MDILTLSLLFVLISLADTVVNGQLKLSTKLLEKFSLNSDTRGRIKKEGCDCLD